MSKAADGVKSIQWQAMKLSFMKEKEDEKRT